MNTLGTEWKETRNKKNPPTPPTKNPKEKNLDAWNFNFQHGLSSFSTFHLSYSLDDVHPKFNFVLFRYERIGSAHHSIENKEDNICQSIWD
jgi:hypothetical protein